MKPKKKPIKAKKPKKPGKKKSLHILPATAAQQYQQIARMKQAMAIVGQVLVHFGAGTRMNAQIFADPKDIRRFVNLLLHSTMANLDILNWDIDPPTRDTICFTAHKHGRLARQMTRGGQLTWRVIYDTLQIVKRDCPGGAGGGLVCAD